MGDAADSMAIAARFAALARKNDPDDYEVVIHTTYYAMHHAARGAVLAAQGSAPTNHGRLATAFARLAAGCDADRGPVHSRALRAAYDLRVLADYGNAGRGLSTDAAELVSQLDSFLEFCRDIASPQEVGQP